MQKIILTLVLSLSVSANAMAFAERMTGKVKGYSPYHWSGNKVIIFHMENNPSGGCNTTGRFALSSAHVNYDAFVAAIMAAYHANDTVAVLYNEACNMFPNAYDLYAFCVGEMVC